jgi:hypothetical protein
MRSVSGRVSTLALLLCVQLFGAGKAVATSLKEAHDLATAASGYDKYIVLDTGVTYTGGLFIGGTFNRITAEFESGGADVCIVGNGAILDLQGAEICISYCSNRLDIQDCVIINGAVRYVGYQDGLVNLVPQGSVTYVTFYKPHDYAVRLFGAGPDILVERNIAMDTVNTGDDFQLFTGMFSEWLPTGVNYALSMQAGEYDLFDNWSFHSDPVANADPQRHFNILCDYG